MSDDPEELNELERTQQGAARAASEDLRAAVDSGDPDERSAAFGQLIQTLSAMDPESTRDKLHVPDDADEHEAGLRAILRRIPDGWGRWISCSRGWYSIIIALDQALAEIDPDYVLHQVKEKFGTLRYYYRTEVEGARERMNTLIRAAETRCGATCELCGEPGVRHSNGRGWILTLCPSCATEKGYGRIGELINDLTVDRHGIWKVTDYAGAESYWDLNHAEVTLDGTRHRDSEVLAPPSVLRTWRIRLEDGREVVSELVASIERVR